MGIMVGPGKYGSPTCRRKAQEQSINEERHEHRARETLSSPEDSRLQRNVELCSCGAQHLMDQGGNPPESGTR